MKLGLMMACVLMSTAWADEAPFVQPFVQLSGYGAVAASRTDTDALGFKLFNQSEATADQWAFDVDSRLAAQLDFNRGQELSAVVQVLGLRRHRDQFQPELEWANLKWLVDDHWSLRAGRMVTPISLESDNRYVGYSLIPTRFNLEVNGLYPLSRHDGVEIRYDGEWWGGYVSAQVYAGSTAAKYPQIELESDVLGGSLTLVDDAWSVRAGYTRLTDGFISGGVIISGLHQLESVLRTPSLQGLCGYCEDLSGRLHRSLTGARNQLYSAGLRYDQGNLYGQIEYLASTTNGFLPDAHAAYALLAYRAGHFTPFVGLADQSYRSRNSAVSGPAPLAAVSNTVSKVLTTNLADRHVVNLGLRWDGLKDVALKAQLDWVRHKYTGTGLAGAYVEVPGKVYDGTAKVLTLAVDFLF